MDDQFKSKTGAIVRVPAGEYEGYFTKAKSETPPTGVGGFFYHKPSAWVLRTAAPSPDRSLVFYAAK